MLRPSASTPSHSRVPRLFCTKVFLVGGGSRQTDRQSDRHSDMQVCMMHTHARARKRRCRRRACGKAQQQSPSNLDGKVVDPVHLKVLHRTSQRVGGEKTRMHILIERQANHKQHQQRELDQNLCKSKVFHLGLLWKHVLVVFVTLHNALLPHFRSHLKKHKATRAAVRARM